MDLLETAAGHALAVVRTCVHDRGFKAASHYYPQIWARDCVITALGALTTGRDEFVVATRHTLESLAEFQCPETGRIANYIPLDQDPVRLPINEAFDSNLWYVIGHDALLRHTGDRAFAQRSIESLRAAIRWARFMDYNNDGLIECHECADWMDTWDHRFHNLSVNVLYAGALAAMARIETACGGDAAPYRARRARVVDMINANFWIHHDDDAAENRYAAFRPAHMANNYAANRAVNWLSDFYFPYLPIKEPAPRRLDTFGNLAAILWDVAPPYPRDRVLNFIDDRALAEPYPIRVSYPVVRPGDRDYHSYYNNRGYCMEHTGHNGGIWAFVGGFYVAALVKAGRHDDAAQHLRRLAELNRLPAGRNDNPHWVSEWGFCEHNHGESGRGIGAQWQAWSAAMYLYALDAVRQGRCFAMDAPA